MSHIDEDDVFRALGSPVRRSILDVVRAQPGLTVLEITDEFEMTRFGIRKHLQILLDAHLLTVEKDGREKRHYLNPIPIQTIYDRWLTHYSRRWAPTLTALKYTIEEEESDMSDKHTHRYEIYIRTTAKQLWKALTTGEMSRKYFYQAPVKSTFEPGDPIQYLHHSDPSRVMIDGEVIEADPPNRLVHTFSFPSNDDPPSTVTWDIEQMDGVCKLTLIHTFDEQNETYRSVGNGWNPILSGLKTLLETGEQLPIPMPEGGK